MEFGGKPHFPCHTLKVWVFSAFKKIYISRHLGVFLAITAAFPDILFPRFISPTTPVVSHPPKPDFIPWRFHFLAPWHFLWHSPIRLLGNVNTFVNVCNVLASPFFTSDLVSSAIHSHAYTPGLACLISTLNAVSSCYKTTMAWFIPYMFSLPVVSSLSEMATCWDHFPQGLAPSHPSYCIQLTSQSASSPTQLVRAGGQQAALLTGLSWSAGLVWNLTLPYPFNLSFSCMVFSCP